MADQGAPSLGFEYEVAIAKIDTTVDVTFAETPYPTIVGAFVVLTCTNDVRVVPPVKQVKALACGYNPAQQLIPAPTIPGRFSFRGLDRATSDTSYGYNGELCVVRVRTFSEDVVVRTQYLNYCTPAIEYRAPEGDNPGEVSGEGMFTDLQKA